MKHETSGPAITALIFAVLGWTVFPLFGSIAALIYAGRAEREITAAPEDLAGIEIIGAARNVAGINLFVWFAVIVFAVVIGVAVGY